MTQADFTIANQTFPNTRTELNTSLQALATNSAGNSAPSTTFANQWWFDSDGNQLYIRNKDNDAWVKVITVGATSDKIDSIADSITIGSQGGVTITTAGVDPHLELVSTEAGSTQSPILDLFRNSSSPADGDVLGQINYYGENSASEKIDYVRVRAGISDVTDGTEDSNYTITTYTGGSQFGRLNILPLETVFNENSTDVDFRVESNGDANMLFVDGGNDKVGIGTSSPQTTLHVEGTAPIIRISDSNSTSEDDAVSKIQFYDRNNTDLNAEIISGTGSLSDLILSAHNNRSLVFQTNGNTERMRIKNDGKVIIGGTDATYGELGIENAGDAKIDLFSNVGSGTEGKAEIFFSTDTSSDHVSCASIVMQQDGGGDRKGEIVFNTSDNGSPSARMFISNSGEVIIGATSNSSPSTSSSATHSAFLATGILHLSASSTSCFRVNRVNSEGTAVELRQAGSLRGSISVAGASASFNTSSDYRLKENISYDWEATSRLKQLKPAKFNWISDDTNTLVDGFIAHEVQPIVPESVNGVKDAMAEILYTSDDVETQGDNPTKNVGDFKEYSTTEIDPQQIDHSKLVPLLVKTIQELEARITALES
jgi:hypothetical protein